MILTSDFKTGLTIEYEGNVYVILDFQHVKSANSMAFVRTKLRNLRTGAITTLAFNSGTKMEQANIEKKKMQYLYSTTDLAAFMDMDTYDQIEISVERLQNEMNYLLEGMEVIVIDYNGEILGVQVPEKVALEVVDCPPGVKGNTAANAQKEAVLETGLRVSVPLFIEVGDKVLISTFDGKYNSRA